MFRSQIIIGRPQSSTVEILYHAKRNKQASIFSILTDNVICSSLIIIFYHNSTILDSQKTQYNEFQLLILLKFILVMANILGKRITEEVLLGLSDCGLFHVLKYFKETGVI